MSAKPQFKLVGTLGAITPQGNEAIAALDEMTEGFSFAVIGPETVGRMGLMSADKINGHLIAGTRVHMIGEKSVDAFLVKSISPILN